MSSYQCDGSQVGAIRSGGNASLLSHLITILLYRPLLSLRSQSAAGDSSAIQICRSAAVDIHAIMSLWGRTFGVCNIVYLMMYTTFVAAGVDVLLMRLGTAQIKAEASKRIQLSLAILEQASEQGPGEPTLCAYG
jgi:hypothetical protein